MRSDYFHVEGALKLTRMRQSEWRRRWGVQGIVSLEQAVSASTDDGHYAAAGAPYTSNNKQWRIGEPTGSAFHGWARWDGVTIPAGATIQTAYITVVCYGGGSGVDLATNLHFEDADDPTYPTTAVDGQGRSRTAAFTAWDAAALSTDDVVDSPDFTTALQEIIDRPGWNSGQALQLLWDDDGSSSSHEFNLKSVDNVDNQPPVLKVTYSA